MSIFFGSSSRWFRRRLAWSNSRQSWQERVGFAGLVGAAAAIAWFSDRLSRAQQVLLWGLLLVAFAVLLRRGWLKLFGPVLFYDLIRTSRRGRYFLIRGAYAGFLLFLLGWQYLATTSFSDCERPSREMAHRHLSLFRRRPGALRAGTRALPADDPTAPRGIAAGAPRRRAFAGAGGGSCGRCDTAGALKSRTGRIAGGRLNARFAVSTLRLDS